MQVCLAAARSAETQIAMPNDLRQVKAFLNTLPRAAFAGGKIIMAKRETLPQISKLLGGNAAGLKLAICRTGANCICHYHHPQSSRTIFL